MPETPQQYTQRILGYVEEKDPLKVQHSTARELKRLTRGLNKNELSKRPAPGKWSIAEILAHLADTELVAGWRLRLILGSNGTPIVAFDQDAWASTLHYEKADPEWSIKAFQAIREHNLRMLKSIPKPLWDNYGMHSERGKETVAHIVRMFAGHDTNHLQQIEGIRRDLKKRKMR
jgi:hypothetical protein